MQATLFFYFSFSFCKKCKNKTISNMLKSTDYYIDDHLQILDYLLQSKWKYVSIKTSSSILFDFLMIENLMTLKSQFDYFRQTTITMQVGQRCFKRSVEKMWVGGVYTSMESQNWIYAWSLWLKTCYISAEVLAQDTFNKEKITSRCMSITTNYELIIWLSLQWLLSNATFSRYINKEIKNE